MVADDVITTEEIRVVVLVVAEVLLQEAKAVLLLAAKVVLEVTVLVRQEKADLEAVHQKEKAFQTERLEKVVLKEPQDVQKALAMPQDQNVREKAKVF